MMCVHESAACLASTHRAVRSAPACLPRSRSRAIGHSSSKSRAMRRSALLAGSSPRTAPRRPRTESGTARESSACQSRRASFDPESTQTRAKESGIVDLEGGGCLPTLMGGGGSRACTDTAVSRRRRRCVIRGNSGNDSLVPEAEVQIANVKAVKTRSGNTRFVVVDGMGREYSTFKEQIAAKLPGLEGKRARKSSSTSSNPSRSSSQTTSNATTKRFATRGVESCRSTRTRR